MRKTGIGRALNELIGERRAGEASGLAMGEMLEDADGAVAVDVSRIRVLGGLNVLAESLIRSLVERAFLGPCDVHVEQPVNPGLQPELHAAGVDHVSFQARLGVLEDLPRFREDLGYQMRYVFNAVQASDLYDELFPGKGREPRGILFPFHREDGGDETGYFYLLEHVSAGRFLRITLESERDSRLRMTRIPHRVAGRIDLVHTRVDVPRAAAEVAQGIAEACGRRGWSYAVSAAQMEDYVRFLRLAGLERVEALAFCWPPSFARAALSEPRARLFAQVARIFCALGDSTIAARLSEGREVRLLDGERRVHVDLSQKGRCLNLSFEAPRVRAGLPECLARMPAVLAASRGRPEAFRGVRVLLVHHLTAEVLGFVQALADMGAARVETLWVQYAGAVEPAFREILLSLPEPLFGFHGVTPVPEADGVSSRFLLSEEFGTAAGSEALAERLRSERHGFFEAMRRVAEHVFFRMAAEAAAAGERLALVEDGGYLAPTLHRLCLAGRTVGEAAAECGVPAESLPEAARGRPLGEWLRGVWVGGVEHTRNGYEALAEVRKERGGLAFPNLSIAVSDFKVNRESLDVAYSCLNAIENAMGAMGFSLTERTALVLGAQGAIGRQTMRILEARLGAERLLGVDVARPAAPPAWAFAADLDGLPAGALGRIDLVFGVVGRSICGAEWIERLLAATERTHLFFASGSTKTAEFAQLSAWLAERAARGGVETAELHDPKTGVRQGRTARLEVGGKTVFVHLLADLMPVNFLYYGVPAETMNRVMAELLRMAELLVRRHAEGRPFPPDLLALDREVDADGRWLARGGASAGKEET